MSQHPLVPDVEVPNVRGDDPRVDVDPLHSHDAAHVIWQEEGFGGEAAFAAGGRPEGERWGESGGFAYGFGEWMG